MILSDNHAIYKKFIVPTQRNLYRDADARTHRLCRNTVIRTSCGQLTVRDEIEDDFSRMKSEGLGKFVKCRSH